MKIINNEISEPHKQCPYASAIPRTILNMEHTSEEVEFVRGRRAKADIDQFERGISYGTNGLIFLSISNGLPGVGLNRKTWEEVQSPKAGTAEKTFKDGTITSGSVTRTPPYVVPWSRRGWEEDYRWLWEDLEFE